MGAKREVGIDVVFDAMGQQQIVAVDEDDIGAARGGQSVEGCRGLAAVARPPDDRRCAGFRLEIVQDRGTFVGRGIVDDDTFDVAIGLVAHGRDEGGQKPAVVEVDDDHAHEGQRHPIAIAPGAHCVAQAHELRGVGAVPRAARTRKGDRRSRRLQRTSSSRGIRRLSAGKASMNFS